MKREVPVYTLLLLANLSFVSITSLDPFVPAAPVSLSEECSADYNEEPDAATLLVYPDAAVVSVDCVWPVSKKEVVDFFMDSVYPNLSDLPNVKEYYNGEMSHGDSRHWTFVLSSE